MYSCYRQIISKYFFVRYHRREFYWGGSSTDSWGLPVVQGRGMYELLSRRLEDSVYERFLVQKRSRRVHRYVSSISSNNLKNADNFLPPANEVWGKVIFLQVSVILFTGRLAYQHASQVTWLWGLPPGGSASRGVGQTPPVRYYGIRSTSARYTC